MAAGKAGKGAGKRSGAGPPGGQPSIIIRREEVVDGGHHGGAWKVAYADFVTAMMAFFLLMWLINATTQDQRRGIAAYFSPMAQVQNGFSGSGMIPGGLSPVADQAQLVDQGPMQLATLEAHGDTNRSDNSGEPDGNAVTPAAPSIVPGSSGSQAASPSPASQAPQAPQASQASQAPQASQDPGASANNAAGQFADAASEEKAFQLAAQRLRDQVAHDPALADAAGQMAIDVVPEGLRIQIMDAEHRPMFDRGSVVPTLRAAGLLRAAAHFLAQLPEPLSIGGHTDAAVWRSGEPSNWTLSSGRADAAREVLVTAGLADRRLSTVIGYADRKLLLPADPQAAANRRVVLTLQRMWPQAQQPGASGAH